LEANRREFINSNPAQPFVYVKTRHIRGEESAVTVRAILNE